MSDEPLQPDEILLRRVHHTQAPGGRLGRGIYTPNQSDTDGLSLYRYSKVSPHQLKASAAKPATEYTVVGIRVADILAAGLTPVPMDDISPHAIPGHCLLPELNISDYSADKKRFVPIQQNLLRRTIAEDQLPSKLP